MFPIELLIRWLARLWKKQRREWLETDALDWPMAFGTVVGTQLKRKNDADPWKGWIVELHYSYTVNGEYYSGLHDLPPDSEDGADAEAGRWRERNIVVRYSPQDVEGSVMLARDQRSAASAEPRHPL